MACSARLVKGRVLGAGAKKAFLGARGNRVVGGQYPHTKEAAAKIFPRQKFFLYRKKVLDPLQLSHYTPIMLIATDPGKSGGVAASEEGYLVSRSLPETRRQLIEMYRFLIGAALKPVTAYIEKIHGFNPGNAHGNMFEFGRNVERPEAILETLGVRIILVTPQQWQKALALGHREPVEPLPRKPTAAQVKAHNNALAKAAREWKNKLKAEAERRFPGVKVTLATCDALLLLDYARMQEGCGSDPEKDLLG